MNSKHAIKSDKRMNPELASEISTLRGMINVGPTSKRFDSKRCDDRPAITITDRTTGRSTTVGLFAANATMVALEELFGAQT